MLRLSLAEARRFLLRHHGLMGPPRFHGPGGVLAFVRQAGCVQFDPVDVCGRSPELVFHARVLGYRPEWLETLLYRERSLVDHFDKNLSIYPVEDWPYFRRERAYYGTGEHGETEIAAVRDRVLSVIRERGPMSARQLGLDGSVEWYWSRATLARAALERMYFAGDLCVFSKQGTVKTYGLAENCLPRALREAPEPLPLDEDHYAWRYLRRVRAVGLIWNRPSDAWLGIRWPDSAPRQKVFERLAYEGKLVKLAVEGIQDPLYMAREDLGTLEEARLADDPPRCALLAPLDSLLWDRKLIFALFGFRYTWEIYTPAHKRMYGAYVLPVLYGDRLVARVAPVCDRKAGVMEVKGLWWEEGLRPDRKRDAALRGRLEMLAAFNGCRMADSDRKG